MKNQYIFKLWLFASVLFFALVTKSQDLDATFGINGIAYFGTTPGTSVATRGKDIILKSDNSFIMQYYGPATSSFPNDARTYVRRFNENGSIFSGYSVNTRGGDQLNNPPVAFGELGGGDQISVTDETFYMPSYPHPTLKTCAITKISASGSTLDSRIETLQNSFYTYEAFAGWVNNATNNTFVTGRLKEFVNAWRNFPSNYSSAPYRGFVASYNLSLDFNTGFGSNGIVTLAGVSNVNQVASAGSNLFVLATTTTTGSFRIIKLAQSNGALQAGFGTSGFLTVTATGLTRLTTDASGDVYFSAGNRITKYNGSNGTVATGWGSSGFVIATTTGFINLNNIAIATDNNNRLLVAYASGNSLVVLRYTTSGDIDLTFSGDGRGISIGGSPTVRSIKTDADNDVYVVGDFLPTGHDNFRAAVWKFKSTVISPNIFTSLSSISGLSTIYGNVSGASTYTISATGLASDITIAASSGLEISLNGSTYFNTLVLTPTMGNVSNTTIFTRIKNNAFAGTITGNVSHSANNAPLRNVIVRGTVSKSVLTITALNTTKIFNTPNPSFTYSISGFKNNENAGVISGVPTLSTSALTNSNVGAYPIFINEGTMLSNNYLFATVSGTLTVAKAEPTLSITSPNSGTVSGSVLLTATNNSGGAVTWSVISGTGANITGGNTLNLTAIGNIVVRATLATTTNYNSRTTEQAFSIVGNTTPILVVDNYTFVFTGTGSFTLPVSSNSPGSISFTTLAWGTEGLNISPSFGIQNPINVNGTGFTVLRVDQLASAPFVATSKIITITGLKGQSVSSITGVNPAHTNPIAGTTYSLSISNQFAAGSPKYTIISGEHATINTSTGSSFRVSVPGVVRVRYERADGTNYFGSFDERTFTFVPATNNVSFSNPNPVSVSYGDAPFSITGFTNPNANERSTVVWSIEPAPLSLNPDAVQITPDGIITVLKPGQVVVRATVPAYDQFGESAAFKILNINKRNATLVGINTTKEYGDENPVYSHSYVGLRANDIASEQFTGNPLVVTSANDASPVGNYTLQYFYTGYITSQNYEIWDAKSAILTIEKAPLTIIPDNKTIEYGQPFPTFTYSITGFKLGQTASVITGTPLLSVTSATGVGSHIININTSGMSASNYRFQSEPGFLTITRKLLTVTATNFTRTYGQANPTFTYSISGFVNSDNASVITGTPTLSTAATTGSNAGTYTISISGESMTAANYDFVFVNGTLTVNKANLTITGGTYTRNYGQANPTFVPTFTGYVNGDNAASSFTGAPSLTTTAINTSNAATYTIAVSQGTLASAKYNFVYINGQLIVNKVVLNAGVVSTSRTYGSANPAFTATYSGFVLSENTSVLSGTPNLNTSANAASPVGAYTINFGLGTLSATNYTFSTSTGTLTITKAILTVTALNASRIYGESNPAFTHTVVGFKNAETASVVTGTPTLNTPATAISNAGTYSITANVSGMSATNYDFVGVNGVLTINKANRTVSITSPNAGRNGTTVTLTGVANPSATIAWSVQNGTGAASISGNQLTLNSVGVVTVTASVASDVNYNATQATQLYTITNLTVPSIVFANINKTYLDAPFALNATSNSPATLVYTVTGSSPANIVQVTPNGMVTILGAGTVTIQVSQAETGGFAATSQSAQLVIAKKMVGIQFVLDSQVGYVGSVMTFGGFGVVGNAPIVWDVVNETGSGSISGNNLALLTEGTFQLRATIFEDANYLENQAWRVITVLGLTPTALTITSINADTVGNNIALIAETSPVGLPVIWSVQNGSGSALVVGNSSLSLTGVGSVTVTGSIAATASSLAASASQVIQILDRPIVTLPGDNTSTPGDNLTSPGDNLTSPGDNLTTPGDNFTTPGDNLSTTGVNQSLYLTSRCNVYPNPASANLFIDDIPSLHSVIQVMNLSTGMIEKASYSREIERLRINIEHLPTGIYGLIISEHMEKRICKFSKQ